VLLASVAHNLTVIARGLIDDAEKSKITRQDALARLQWLNELMHVLTGGLRDSVGGWQGYPRDVLVRVMYERAQRGNLEGLFSRLCMGAALARVIRAPSEPQVLAEQARNAG